MREKTRPVFSQTEEEERFPGKEPGGWVKLGLLYVITVRKKNLRKCAKSHLVAASLLLVKTVLLYFFRSGWGRMATGAPPPPRMPVCCRGEVETSRRVRFLQSLVGLLTTLAMGWCPARMGLAKRRDKKINIFFEIKRGTAFVKSIFQIRSKLLLGMIMAGGEAGIWSGPPRPNSDPTRPRFPGIPVGARLGSRAWSGNPA